MFPCPSMIPATGPTAPSATTARMTTATTQYLSSFPRFIFMVMPPGAFLSLGVLLALATAVQEMRRRRRRVQPAPVPPTLEPEQAS